MGHHCCRGAWRGPPDDAQPAFSHDPLFTRVQSRHHRQDAAPAEPRGARVGAGDGDLQGHPLPLAHAGREGRSRGSPGPERCARAQQRAEVRRGAGDERAGCRGTERLLPRAGPLPPAGRGLADGRRAGKHAGVGSHRAGAPARGSTADHRPDARASLQGEGVGGDRRPAGAPKKVRALFMDPADGTSTWRNDAP